MLYNVIPPKCRLQTFYPKFTTQRSQKHSHHNRKPKSTNNNRHKQSFNVLAYDEGWRYSLWLEPKSRKHPYPISRDVNSWRGKQQLTPNDSCEKVQNSLRRRVNYRRTITSGVSGSDLRFSNNYFCTVNSQSSNTSNSISPNDELYVYAQNRNPCLFWSRAYQRPIKARLGLLLVMSSQRMRSATLMVF